MPSNKAAHLCGFLFVLLLAMPGFAQNPLGFAKSPLFKIAKKYPSGSVQPTSIAVADVNSDGKPDVIIVSNHDCCDAGIVGIMLGNGDGTFQPVQNYDAGGQLPTSVTAADVNGDGKIDLVIAHSLIPGSVSVLLGNGDGTFQPAQSFYSGGAGALSAAVGDINGDGKLDLVVDNVDDGQGGITSIVGVLVGNGDGTFQPVQTYSTGRFYGGGATSNTIALADLSHDGKLDILEIMYCVRALGCEAGGFLGVLTGNGDGTFQPVQLYNTGGLYPTSIAVGDVNGDGNLDVVAEDYLLLGNGDGTFQPGRAIGGGGMVALADINRDGHLDVLNGYDCTAESRNGCAHFYQPLFSMLGNGDGTFYDGDKFDSGGNSANWLAVADVNGDGKPDLLVANECVTLRDCSSGVVGVLLNDVLFPTTTSLSSAPNPSVEGQAVTFTVTVTTGSSYMPTGKVTIKTGRKTLASVKLTNGTAQLTRKNLPVGSLSVTATYEGDTNLAKSTSPAVIQVVNPSGARH
jgi:hypothetical protein